MHLQEEAYKKTVIIVLWYQVPILLGLTIILVIIDGMFTGKFAADQAPRDHC